MPEKKSDPEQDWSLSEDGWARENTLQFNNVKTSIEASKGSSAKYAAFTYLEDKDGIVSTYLTADEAENIATVLLYLAQEWRTEHGVGD